MHTFYSNLYLSIVSGSNCISVEVLRNCKPKLSHTQVEVFNMCLKESHFRGCWNGSFVVSVYKNVRESSTAKN